jgi:3-oxoacyl-[acyl-carrier-protein] synthase II
MVEQDRPRVAVTGVGLVTPLGLCAADTVARSLAGESAIGPMQPLACEGRTCSAAAFVPAFDGGANLRFPKNQKFMTHAVMCATRAAREALDQSGIAAAGLDSARIALYTGSGQTGLEYDEFFRALSLAWPEGREMDFKYLGGIPSRLIDPYFSIRTLSNGGLALISIELGIRGSSTNHVQSDTASAQSVISAYFDLIEGRCDAAIAGGHDSLLGVSSLLAYLRAGVLSSAEPATAYRPFDRSRDGLVTGAGAGFLVMERWEDARARGAVILGEICGVGCAMEVGGCWLPGASAETLQDVVAHAGCESADFVVAAGLGTADSDRAEAAALSTIAGGKVPVTALKSQTGYLGAATGVVELAIGLLCARQGFVAPIARHTAADEDCGLDLVSGHARALAGEQASGLFLSYSWAGQVAAIVARAVRN